MAESQKKKAAEPALAESARWFDRGQLGAKTRVHALAKMLGGTSKELVGALKDLGWNKVAQSTLSQEEATALLDHLAGGAQPLDKKAPAKGAKKRAEKAPKAENPRKKKDEAAEDASDNKENKENKEKKPRRSRKRAKPEESKDGHKDAAQAEEQARPEPAPEPEQARAEEESVERIRHRVEKNVANEIHQIEEKVDKDLSEQVAHAEVAQEEPEASPRERDEPAEEPEKKPRRRARKSGAGKAAKVAKAAQASAESEEPEESPAQRNHADSEDEGSAQDSPRERDEEEGEKGRGRRRHRRAVRRTASEPAEDRDAEASTEADSQEDEEAPEAKKPRRRGRRGTRRGRGAEADAAERASEERPQGNDPQEPEETDEGKEEIQEPVALKGSTRLEAQRRRRSERSDEARRKRHVISQAEFLARRESVERTMVVRERDRHDHHGVVTQVGVLEDDLLVEHFVTSDQQTSMIGNIYLGRVQNVLPSMEAAFIDIGKGRNGVLYAGEVDWKAAGLGGRSRRIEQALRAGDQVLVQVTKDPVGHKGARLTTQVSLAGRFLVYVPGGRSAGISRKLPGPERKRLKEILKEVVPNQGGAIIRTAAEGVPEEAIAADVRRLHGLWEDIQERAEQEKASRGATPVTLYEEPDMLVKVVRDLFNEDFGALVVEGRRAWNTVQAYVHSVAPDLEDRLTYYNREEHGGTDVFEAYRVEEQLQKALARMVWLPSGGSLVMDRTEAMTVIDVNTGRFTGSGGNLEETVTRNNLEAAEEIVRQLRLRDVGGMIVIDFIDMVLPENRDLVLRRLKEALGRDRTRHQVSEVTSLGLVQLTRKRLGTGLVEIFSTECPTCEGRGLLLHDDPVEHGAGEKAEKYAEADRRRKGKKQQDRPAKEPRRSIEELASAVVPADDAEEEPVSDVEKIAAAAVETADELDPHEPNGAHYERAVAEFEASPRRKRRTRGNSRSDRRPRPEDFAPEAQAPAQESGTEEPAGSERSEAAERSDAIRRRHRRRAVRRAAGRRSSDASSRQQATQPRRGAAPTEREEAAPSSAAAPRRRGRRRVTRRRG